MNCNSISQNFENCSGTDKKNPSHFREIQSTHRSFNPPNLPMQIKGRTPRIGKLQEIRETWPSAVGRFDLPPQPPSSAKDVRHPNPEDPTHRPKSHKKSKSIFTDEATQKRRVPSAKQMDPNPPHRANREESLTRNILEEQNPSHLAAIADN